MLGVPLGLAAGYIGGKVDFVITRIADVLFAFPGLLLAILVAAIFGPAVTDQFGGAGRLALVAGALSLVSWPLMTRLVRSQTLAIREQDYVMAAESLGANGRRILWRHVAPQLIGLVVTTATLNVSGVIINEAVLSLLGLGIQPPDSSIGKMIADAMPYLESNTAAGRHPEPAADGDRVGGVVPRRRTARCLCRGAPGLAATPIAAPVRIYRGLG